jgi:CRP-like cAMP-binding protein
MVRVLDEDPNLAAAMTPQALATARSDAIAPLLALPRGAASFSIESGGPGDLGLLVLDGMLAQHAWFGQMASIELLGPGDLLRPWVSPAYDEEMSVEWETLTPVRLAVLDRDFAVRIRSSPELIAALLDRTNERAYAQLHHAALRQARTVEDRVLLVLWHLAGRWGHVGSDGRILLLPQLTGEVLARIVGARRQSVSQALGELTRRGAIRRRPDRGWVIPVRPPQLERGLHGGSARKDRGQRPRATSGTRRRRES